MLCSPPIVRRRGGYEGSRSSGFTLIELLTVIAIIGVLAGLLFPTLGKARAKGRQVVCMSNMRHLWIALQMYTTEYRGVLPRSGDSDSAGLEGCWFYAVDPYLLGMASKTQTPAQKTALFKQDPIWKTFDSNARTNWHTIKMNRKLIGTKNGKWTPYNDKLDGPPAPDPMYRSVLTIADSVNTVLLFDGRCEESDSFQDKERYDGWETYAARRHSGGANVLFVDGHAEWRMEKQQMTGMKYGWANDQTTLKWWATD